MPSAFAQYDFVGSSENKHIVALLAYVVSGNFPVPFDFPSENVAPGES